MFYFFGIMQKKAEPDNGSAFYHDCILYTYY